MTVSIKFDEVYVEPILEGRKFVTIRHGFERELDIGEEVRLLEAESGDAFARAFIDMFASLSARRFVEGPSWDGHRSYDNLDELLEELRRFYPEADIGPLSELTVIRWRDLSLVDEFDHVSVQDSRDRDEVQEVALDLEVRP